MRPIFHVHVDRLAKKEVCHSNRIWHASIKIQPFLILTALFPPGSIQIKPTLDKLFRNLKSSTSNWGSWKVVRDIMETTWEKGVLSHPDAAPAHKSVVAIGCYVWLWHWTGWSPSIFSWFGTTLLFSVPQHIQKQTNTRLAAKQYRTDEELISTDEDFFEDQDESFCTTEIQALQHRWKKCVDFAGETLLKNTPQLVKFNHCIIVSLWTFQPILVWTSMQV